MLEHETKALAQQKRSSDKVGDKVRDMNKITHQQKRSSDNISFGSLNFNNIPLILQANQIDVGPKAHHSSFDDD